MPPETPTVTFMTMIVREWEPLRLPVLWGVRVRNNLVGNLKPGLGRRRDLARGNLFLGDTASLVGAGINQRLGPILKLPGAAGRHDHVAKIAVESMFCRHLASCRKFIAGVQARVACMSSRPNEASTGYKRPVAFVCRHLSASCVIRAVSGSGGAPWRLALSVFTIAVNDSTASLRISLTR